MKQNIESKKVDKGFELIYWRLSYRRKLIRTLWMIPFGILAIILTWMAWQSIWITVIATVVIVITEMVQTLYNYKKWRKS